ncbi:hypothetical protein BDR06DRAFT_980669 [Suillus hirtellus]|nr:hypothetical protein BDR06DRAFT_980669 [Suillus hirtellus]
MAALLDQHNKFICFPIADSDDTEKAHEWVEEKTCLEWQNDIFAIDGSTANLINKSGLHGKVFFNRKSTYSLNCQLVIMPHNLLIANYSVGHTGSTHDVYAFQSTQLYQEHTDLLDDDHWTWCVPPFKKPWNGALLHNQQTFNYH